MTAVRHAVSATNTQEAVMRQTVILPPTKLLIGGDWGDAQEGKRFSTINPANEETIAEVARGGVADVDVAVKAARQALSGPWGMMSGIQRARILNKLATSFGSGSKRSPCWRASMRASRWR